MDVNTGPVNTAVNTAWNQWTEIKDTVTDFGFREWCERVGGFTHGCGHFEKEISYTVVDDAKFMWFMLKWA